MTLPIFPTSLDEPVTVGVVGLGYWGPNLIRNLTEIESAQLSWICDLDQSRLDMFGRRYPSVGCTRDFDSLIADPELEAIVIATPISTHYPLARPRCSLGSMSSSRSRSQHRWPRPRSSRSSPASAD